MLTNMNKVILCQNSNRCFRSSLITLWRISTFYQSNVISEHKLENFAWSPSIDKQKHANKIDFHGN